MTYLDLEEIARRDKKERRRRERQERRRAFFARLGKWFGIIIGQAFGISWIGCLIGAIVAAIGVGIVWKVFYLITRSV